MFSCCGDSTGTLQRRSDTCRCTGDVVYFKYFAGHWTDTEQIVKLTSGLSLSTHPAASGYTGYRTKYFGVKWTGWEIQCKIKDNTLAIKHTVSK